MKLKWICSCLLVLGVVGVWGVVPSVAAEGDVICRAETLPETTPWDLEALSRPPAFEWGEGEEVRTLYFAGEPYQGKPTRVFAYYATPGSLAGDASLDKQLPTMVLVHGGGGQAFAEWARLWASRGYAAIAMDLAGNGPERVRLADGGPNQGNEEKFGAINEPVTDQWSYHAVANVIRAHSLVRSFAEVDADRTAITGISWGGYLTCIVSGLDNRFKAAVPVYGCGFLQINSAWMDVFAAMSAAERSKWNRLWDPSQYVGSAAMPMLFVNGGNDFAYPPDSYAKTFELVKTAKNLHFVPNLPHGHIFDRPQSIEVFIDQQLRGGVPLAKVGPLEIGDQVSARVKSKTKLVAAELHYTKGPLPVKRDMPRDWVSVPASLEGDRIAAELPPAGATIWFLTVRDERGVTVASEIVLPGE